MFGLEHPSDVLVMSGWVLFAVLFLTPFLQEDFGVIVAATASLAGTAPTPYLALAILCGLTASDAWKYWMGRLARRYEWAHKFAEKPGVSIAGNLIRKEFVQTMLTARFVPGTRIPTYIAAGFFKAHYPKYILTLIFTASLYIAIVFSLFHSVGAVAGEEAIIWLPIGAIGLLVTYILYRWFTHVNSKQGPMTPMSEAYDHPIPEADETIEKNTETQTQEAQDREKV